MDNPKCPARMPTKKMKAVPSEMPKNRIFHSPMPIVEMSEITPTACRAECSTSRSLSHSILTLCVLTAAKVGQIFGIAAFRRGNLHRGPPGRAAIRRQRGRRNAAAVGDR